jgi:ElaB/YqjD/DUF883 family membrane-anchored ribosome-binding protein
MKGDNEMAELNPKTAKPADFRATPIGDDAEAQLRAIRAELAALAEMVNTFARGEAHALRVSAEKIAEEAAATARKVRGELAHGVGQAEKALDHRVQEHPLQSILMAFGLGVLISLLVRR